MKMMRFSHRSPCNLALGVAIAALLAGCGSNTKTVTVAATPPPSTATTASSTTPTTKAPPVTTTATTTETTTSATTRTAPEPAFTEQETHAEGATAAAALVHGKGFTASNLSEYHADQTLRVLVGTRTGSSDGHGQQAFFFLDGRYLGTDTKEPSADLKVVAQSDTEVSIAYPLYRHEDPLCCPSGGQAIVHFQLDNGKLTPIGKIPPGESATGLSRN
jgi:hypothetical protein